MNFCQMGLTMKITVHFKNLVLPQRPIILICGKIQILRFDDWWDDRGYSPQPLIRLRQKPLNTFCWRSIAQGAVCNTWTIQLEIIIVEVAKITNLIEAFKFLDGVNRRQTAGALLVHHVEFVLFFAVVNLSREVEGERNVHFCRYSFGHTTTAPPFQAKFRPWWFNRVAQSWP